MEPKFKPGDTVLVRGTRSWLTKYCAQIGEIEVYEGKGWYLVVFEEPGKSINRLQFHEDDLEAVARRQP